MLTKEDMPHPPNNNYDIIKYVDWDLWGISRYAEEIRVLYTIKSSGFHLTAI